MRQTVFVLMDAFRWDYLDPARTPFLAQLARCGTHGRRLVPGAGFCERSEIVTGAPPNVTGNVTAIGFDPEASPFRRHAAWLRVLHAVDRLAPRRGYGRKVAWRLARKLGITMPLYRIPLGELRHFALTEDRFDHRDAGSLAVESIFDVLREDGGRIGWHYTALGVPNGTDEDRLDSLARGLEQGADLHLLYLEAPDRDGHRFGPESAAMGEALAAFDRTFGERMARLRDLYPLANFVLVGDHGMTTVVEPCDVSAAVLRVAEGLGWKRGRDYLTFLDSTLARFWFRHPSMADVMEEALERTVLGRLGTFLDADRARALELPLPGAGSPYGERAWWARPGVLIAPDAFHDGTECVRGMHGYDPEHPCSQGTLLAFGDSVARATRERVALRDVCKTLCDLIGIRAPRGNVGRSVLEATGGCDGKANREVAALHHRLRVQ
ncbi:MAG: alkaline phosphatase family protein [Planctomycetes bacterium]|nr:alkaline phosphatase family protein [Planctomycetota bacterium]